MKTNNILKTVGLGLAISALAAFNAGAVVQYNAFDTSVSSGGTSTGNQTSGPYNLGTQFTANQNLSVTSLGAFDSGLDGFGAASITVAIYNSLGAVLGSAVFTGTAGTLGNAADSFNSSYRFQSVSAINLVAGQTYMIVASGLGSVANPDYNSGYLTNPSLTPIQNNTGGGALTFGNNYYSSFGGSPSFPNTIDAGPVGRYGGGSFEFSTLTPVPETQVFVTAGMAMLGLVFIGRKVATHRSV